MHNLLQNETARVLILISNGILPSSPYTILFVALLGSLNKYLQNLKCTSSMSLYGYGAYISLPYNNTGVTNESNSSDIRYI